MMISAASYTMHPRGNVIHGTASPAPTREDNGVPVVWEGEDERFRYRIFGTSTKKAITGEVNVVMVERETENEYRWTMEIVKGRHSPHGDIVVSLGDTPVRIEHWDNGKFEGSDQVGGYVRKHGSNQESGTIGKSSSGVGKAESNQESGTDFSTSADEPSSSESVQEDTSLLQEVRDHDEMKRASFDGVDHLQNLKSITDDHDWDYEQDGEQRAVRMVGGRMMVFIGTIRVSEPLYEGNKICAFEFEGRSETGLKCYQFGFVDSSRNTVGKCTSGIIGSDDDYYTVRIDWFGGDMLYMKKMSGASTTIVTIQQDGSIHCGVLAKSNQWKDGCNIHERHEINKYVLGIEHLFPTFKIWRTSSQLKASGHTHLYR